VAKSVHDDVLDGALNIIKNNCTRITACSTQPTTYTEANATYALADVTVDSTDFTVANGDTSGRKLTVAAQSAVPVDTSGTYQHVALLDVANSKLLYVTTGTSQALTSGNTANFPAWDIEIADPA
jgi:Flp pilus assembly protein TadG